MKKFVLLSILGAFLTLVSCQKNDPDGNGGGRQTNVKISAVVPAQGFKTRAMAPRIPDGFQIRYILEVYTGGVPVQHIAQFSPDFNVRLVTSTDYDFVLWADYVPDAFTDPAANYHYDAGDLRSISAIAPANYQINDPSRDAFYCTESLTVVGSFTTAFTLQRPFAQIRIKTDDLAAIPIAAQQPAQVGITYTAGIGTGFNAMTGTTTAAAAAYPLVFGQQAVEAAPYSAADETTAAGWLAFDYIFANRDNNGLVDFTLSMYNSTGELITTNDRFVNIPIKQNYRTNISGNLLTAGGAISVVIDPGFINDDFNYDMSELQALSDFQNALDALTPANIQTVAYRVDDVDVSTLNIDGSKLVNVPSILLSLKNGLGGGTLTVNGGSYAGIIKIDAGDSPSAALIVNAPGATVSVAGTIGRLDAATSGNTLLIGNGVTVGTLNLLAGNAEIFGAVNNFGTVASGCKVYWGATDAASLKAAHKYADPNDGIILGADISGIDTEIFVTRPGYLIDGRGFKLSGPVSVSGQTGQSSTNMINLAAGCNNAVVRNIGRITNMLGNGINVFNSTGVTVDKVSLVGNGQAGLIVNGSEVTASGIASSGNGWYFANVDMGTTNPRTPHLTMSGANNITDAVAIYTEGNYCAFNGKTPPAGAKDASGWVSGGNWVPVYESFTITDLIAVGNYGGRFSYVWAPDNGSNALESDVLWGIDRFLSRSYALTANGVQTTIVPLSQTVASSDKFREWQGLIYSPSFAADVNSWSAETGLQLENGLTNTLQSFWVVVSANSTIIDYVAVAYASNDMPDAYGGPYSAGWLVYNSASNTWNSVGGVSTSQGAHALKISRSGITTSVLIDGVPVLSYDDTDPDPDTQSSPGQLLFNAKTYTNPLTTTWSYPKVN